MAYVSQPSNRALLVSVFLAASDKCRIPINTGHLERRSTTPTPTVLMLTPYAYHCVAITLNKWNWQSRPRHGNDWEPLRVEIRWEASDERGLIIGQKITSRRKIDARWSTGIPLTNLHALRWAWCNTKRIERKNEREKREKPWPKMDNRIKKEWESLRRLKATKIINHQARCYLKLVSNGYEL